MRLNVEERGAGNRHAVLVHGLSSDASTWEPLMPHLLAQGYHVLAPELRGHGLSPRGEYNLDAWADDLLESVTAEPDLVVAISFGALIAARATDALRAHRAIFIDPSWYAYSTDETTLGAIRERKLWGPADWTRAFPSWDAAEIDAKVKALQKWDPTTANPGNWGPKRPYYYEAPAPNAPTLILLPPDSQQVSADQMNELVGRGYFVSLVPESTHAIHQQNLSGLLLACRGWLTPALPNRSQKDAPIPVSHRTSPHQRQDVYSTPLDVITDSSDVGPPPDRSLRQQFLMG